LSYAFSALLPHYFFGLIAFSLILRHYAIAGWPLASFRQPAFSRDTYWLSVIFAISLQFRFHSPH